MIPKSTRPREIIYFFFLPIQTIDKGVVYCFMAQDDFSQYVFSLGIEQVISKDVFLRQIKVLLLDEKFKQPNQLPFRIVVQSAAKEIEKEIIVLIKDKNGSVIFDDDLLEKNISDFAEDFYNNIGNKK
jgi:hypothetical protein